MDNHMNFKNFDLKTGSSLEGWYQQFNSLVDYYHFFSQRFKDKEAFVQFGTSISYGAIWRQAEKLAAFLQKKGIKAGDRVAIILPNCMPYPVSIMAVHKVGAVIINLNPEYTAHELNLRLADAAPKMLIVLDCFAAKLAEVLESVPVSMTMIVSIGDLLPSWKRVGLQLLLYFMQRIPRFYIPNAYLFRDALKEGEGLEFSPVFLGKEDLAFLQYTGGTTGTIKAAILTHGNLLANLEQTRLLFGDSLKEGEEISIFALPLYHIFCLTVNFLLAMGIGVKHIMIADPRQLGSLIKQVRPFPVTIIMGVSTLFDKLSRHPNFSSLNLSQLKLVIAGGMSVQESVAKRWQEMTGVPILEGYGLTETSPVVCMTDLKSTVFNGSIGKPVAETELLFLDDQGQPVKEGEIGELAIRGPQVMSAYWNKEEETKQVFNADHYFLTGDMGYRDAHGFIFLKERKKDMIDVSGLKVYPSEVEAVLLEQPHIIEAAVIGEKTEQGTERVVAYVVTDDASLLEQEIIHICRKKLVAYKLPKKIYFRESLPKNNIGKILKRALNHAST